MGRTTLIVHRCDRCLVEVTLAEPLKPEGWAGLRAAGPDDVIESDKGGPQDFCPACFATLLAWYRAGTAPPPTSAPPAAVVPRRPTLLDRKSAIAFVTTGLRSRTEFALEVVRNQPTAILTGDFIPGTLFGIEDSAAGIVDGVLDILRLSRADRRAGSGDREPETTATPIPISSVPAADTAGAHPREPETLHD